MTTRIPGPGGPEVDASDATSPHAGRFVYLLRTGKGGGVFPIRAVLDPATGPKLRRVAN